MHTECFKAAPAAATAAQDSGLYATAYDETGIDGRTNLYHIDPATETVTHVATVKKYRYVSAIAFGRDGRLYGWGFRGGFPQQSALFVIDIVTGATELIGSKKDHGVDKSLGDIDFKKTGKGFRLLANGGYDPDVVPGLNRIKKSGAVKAIGDIDDSSDREGNAIAISADGKIFMADDEQVRRVTMAGKIVRKKDIDFGVLLNPGDTRVNSATFGMDGVLWGILNTEDSSTADPTVAPQHLVTINTKTGVVTGMFALPENTHFDGLAAQW